MLFCSSYCANRLFYTVHFITCCFIKKTALSDSSNTIIVNEYNCAKVMSYCKYFRFYILMSYICYCFYIIF